VPALFSQKQSLLWLLLAAGVIGSGLIGLNIARDIERKAADQFAFAADQVTLTIDKHLQICRLALNGAAGLLSAAGNVSRDEWRTYAEKLSAEHSIPGEQGIGYSQIIAPADLQKHIATVRAEGFPEYKVWPEGERELYTSILYLEPFSGRNLRAFGYDMYTEPVRRAAMAEARDHNRATLSGRVRLVQETDADVQAGVLMYAPVYRNGKPLATVAQRRDALLGWVYSPYRMNDLMSDILKDWQRREGQYLGIHIFDGPQHNPDAELYRSASNYLRNPESHFFQQRTLNFLGKTWLLEFGRLPDAPAIDYGPAWIALANGLSVTLLLFILAKLMLRTEVRALRIADELTEDIREREKALQESEFRWKFALEGAGDGVWDMDINRQLMTYSTRACEMFGYAPDDIGNQIDEWQDRLHPDDRERVLSALEDYLSGKSPSYQAEQRLLCKDGRYKWALSRGMIVSRDSEERPLRVIGTISDIDAAKALEISLREKQTELLAAQRIGKIGSWQLDIASGKVEWTEELYRMFLLDPSQPAPDFARHREIFTAESFAKSTSTIAHAVETGEPYEIEAELVRADGSRGWLLARGEVVRSADGTISGVRGTASDITESIQSRLRIQDLNRLYSALSACNAAIVHCESEDVLFARICEIVVQQGGMKMAWIGLLNAASGRIIPRYSHGYGTEYLQDIEISVEANDPRGRGPTGSAVRENRPYWLDNFPTNPITAPWRDKAASYGWQSSAALPICRSGIPVGALTFYSAESGWLNEEIRNLLLEMAGDISFALDKFSAEQSARSYQATLKESEQRFRVLIEQSIAGAYIIQDRVLAYANPRFNEILGYSQQDDLSGRSPLDFISPADQYAARERMRRLLAGEVTHTEGLFSAVRKDGGLVEVSTNSSLASYRERPAIIGLMQDLSDRKVAEDQIKRYAVQLEDVFMQTVKLTTNLVEMRDPYTAGHERRVAELAVAIGMELGMEQQQIEALRIGGYLHDVGKIIVPAEILTKPGKLSPLEFALIQNHARAGYDILKEVVFPWPVADIAHQHHERIDGSGYPQGLKGEEIIIEARIVAVADVVESMTTHRPYRAGLGIDAALEEIELGKGSRYDTAVADICLQLFREKGYQIT
jgi:PAS domain S-box-containing protein/putative nucleotidyltransferase with HDIG domain